MPMVFNAVTVQQGMNPWKTPAGAVTVGGLLLEVGGFAAGAALANVAIMVVSMVSTVAVVALAAMLSKR